MSGEPTACTLIRRYATLFWDFDGVIKESLAVKADAFERLFAPFGAALAARVRTHHERNGGQSRFDKVPLYLQWAGQQPSAAEITRYSGLYSAAVCQRVIACEWVPGAREYLLANHARQLFVLVTGTPQAEIEHIVQTLGIAQCFREVHGSPLAKAEAVCGVLARECPRPALLIGDSASDRSAAQAAGIDFMLRRTPLNGELQRACDCPQFDDFRDV